MNEQVAPHQLNLVDHIRVAYRELLTREARSLPRWAYTAFHPFKILIRALEEFQRNQCVTRASGLAFVTLLAIVPLTFVVFQLFSASSAFAETKGQVQDWLFNYLLPAKSGEVQGFLLGAVNAGGGTLTPFAVAMLVVTCLLLLNTIESTFNAIWGVTRSRPLNRRIVAYWTVLTMPVLLITLSQIVSGQVDAWLQSTVGGVPALYGFVLRVLSMVPTWLGFACAYLFVPYTIVRPRAAFIGGVAAGSLWEMGKIGYIAYSRTMFSNIEGLYGPLSTIPVTLIWLYVSWLIVILGAEVTFAIQFPESPVTPGAKGDTSQRAYREYYAIRVMTAIVRHYMAGTSSRATSHALAAELETPPDVLLPLLDDLRTGGLLLTTEDEAWVPARPPNSLTVQHVVSATGDQQFGVPPGLADPVTGELRTHFDHVRDSLREHLASLTLTDLAARGDS